MLGRKGGQLANKFGTVRFLPEPGAGDPEKFSSFHLGSGVLLNSNLLNGLGVNLMNRFYSSLFVSLILILTINSLAFAQKAKERPPTDQELVQTRLETEKVVIQIEKLNFQHSISLLAQKCHLNLISDDIPQKREFSLNFKGTIKALIDNLAEAFDYTWRVNNQGDIAMMRQFLEPTGYPQAHYNELKQTSQEMQNLFATLNLYSGPKAFSENRMRDFYFSLSSAQIEYMKNGNLLYPNQLTPQQFKLYRDAATCFIFGEVIEAWNLFEFRFGNLRNAVIGFEKMKFGERIYFSPVPEYKWEDTLTLRLFDTSPPI